MKLRETILAGEVQGILLIPEASNGLGIIVLAGSSGRVDVTRARLLANQGAVVIALRWFGGEGQVPGICEVPLETFIYATDKLVEQGCERIAYVGTSKGAEAALLTAVHDSRVNVVVAISPSSVVWANIGPGRDGIAWPQRSSWTLNGIPLPFIPFVMMEPPPTREGLVSYRGSYEQSLVTFAADVPGANIQIEKARAEVLLVAGGDDALWPSNTFAKSIADRLAVAGKEVSLIYHPEAGHRVLLPTEQTLRSAHHAHGGNDLADAELGRSAWNGMLTVLHLEP